MQVYLLPNKKQEASKDLRALALRGRDGGAGSYFKLLVTLTRSNEGDGCLLERGFFLG